jgi:membrane protein YqaA with SNARE-associated domain
MPPQKAGPVSDTDKPATPTGVTDKMIREEIQAHGLVRRVHVIRRLYEWVLGWAETRYAGKAMALLAFGEGIVLPVPADVLLIALCLGRPKSSFRWAGVCTFWSVIGGTTAMLIGLAIGKDRVVEVMGWVGQEQAATRALDLLKAWGFWTVAVAALTPVPYNVCSWLAGFSDVQPLTYVLASVIFRPMRFFGVAALVFIFGAPAKRFIDKYFNLATWLVMALVVGIVVLLKYGNRLFGG